MTTKFIESSYEQIAEQIADARNQITELSIERDNVRARFSNKAGFLTTVGVELERTLTKAIHTVEVIIQDWNDLLTQKLSESVEEKLGLGQVATLA